METQVLILRREAESYREYAEYCDRLERTYWLLRAADCDYEADRLEGSNGVRRESHAAEVA